MDVVSTRTVHWLRISDAFALKLVVLVADKHRCWFEEEHVLDRLVAAMETRLPALLHAADMQRVHAVPARTKDNSSSNPYAVQEIWADEDDGAQWSGAFRLRPAIADDELTHVVLVTKMMHGDDRAVATNGHNYYDPVTVHRQVQLVATAVPRGVLIDYPPFV